MEKLVVPFKQSAEIKAKSVLLIFFKPPSWLCMPFQLSFAQHASSRDTYVDEAAADTSLYV